MINDKLQYLMIGISFISYAKCSNIMERIEKCQMERARHLKQPRNGKEARPVCCSQEQNK